MTLLAVEGITKTFGGLRALDNVSLAVNKGSVVGLMGANGAGKTTLFSLIAGNARPDSGNITFRNDAITGNKPERICRMGIARTFQIVRPFRSLTVHENVMIGARFGQNARGSRLIEVCRESIELAGLATMADKPAADLTLSGQKRLEVARALATGPDLLLLDEVMAGLTPAEVMSMLETLASLRRNLGITLLVIEHVMRALMDLSDSIVTLHHGQVIASGTPDEIGRDPAVRACYLGLES
ncbi:MAG: ABC transporter ATP-binding protein [Alphaproteobacteria bacterium]|nr:ABC transporter ATP-binding protein [Rhodospirillaceae bacterium]MDG2479971.1 ABC transporter ATP-binding protein [Alphaproteobacteria bacterium]